MHFVKPRVDIGVGLVKCPLIVQKVHSVDVKKAVGYRASSAGKRPTARSLLITVAALHRNAVT